MTFSTNQIGSYLGLYIGACQFRRDNFVFLTYVLRRGQRLDRQPPYCYAQVKTFEI